MSRQQIFCFTYAGGTASFFDEIGKDLSQFELVKPEYPGHGARHREPFCVDFNALGKDVFDAVKAAWNGGNYALFGYSMGAVTLVEVLKRIMADGDMRLPRHVYLAAHEPHTRTELEGFSPDELDDWVKRRTVAFGAVPEQLLDNRTFWRLYLPLYRADYLLLGSYRFEAIDFATDVPATIFYSETDTPCAEMRQWKRYFVGECFFLRFEGDHFFIRQHHAEMANIITAGMVR